MVATNDLIKGKFYKFVYNNQYYYFQFEEIKGDEIVLGGGGNFYNLKNFLDYYDYEEVEISEFIGFLPQNHPERINFRKQRIERLLT